MGDTETPLCHWCEKHPPDPPSKACEDCARKLLVAGVSHEEIERGPGVKSSRSEEESGE